MARSETFNLFGESIAIRSEKSAATARRIVGDKSRCGRSGADYYSTPPWATKKLLDCEIFEGTIWEPACGNGAMAEVIDQYYPGKVYSSDLFDRGFGDVKINFLASSNRADNIVTNPPFTLAEKFLMHAKEQATHKIAFLLKLGFLESKRRKLLLETSHFPLSRVYVFSERVSFILDGHTTNNQGGMIAFAWFVWNRTHEGPAELNFL